MNVCGVAHKDPATRREHYGEITFPARNYPVPGVTQSIHSIRLQMENCGRAFLAGIVKSKDRHKQTGRS